MWFVRVDILRARAHEHQGEREQRHEGAAGVGAFACMAHKRILLKASDVYLHRSYGSMLRGARLKLDGARRDVCRRIERERMRTLSVFVKSCDRKSGVRLPAELVGERVAEL